MKKKIGRYKNIRICAGDKNLMGKHEGFVENGELYRREGKDFFNYKTGEKYSPEPPVTRSYIAYTATEDLKAFNDWTISNIDQKASTWNSTTGKGILVFNREVTQIDDYAFWGCTALTAITISDSITSIGANSFHRCNNITSVTIGIAVEYIGSLAFEECSNLNTVNFNAISCTINTFNPPFISHSIQTVTIGDSVTIIPESIFSNQTNLTSVIIPDSVETIGNSAFFGCIGLTTVNISDSVKVIGASAFSACRSLTSINIPNSVTEIGNLAFAGCSNLTSIIIPDSVNVLGNNAFKSCSNLISAIIGNSVTSISNSAFKSCSSLKSVTIGNSVISIDDYAFEECSSLTSVTCLAIIPPTLGTYNFTANSDTLYVPLSAVSTYQADSSWNQRFATIVPTNSIIYTATSDLKAYSSSGSAWPVNNINQSLSTWDSTTQKGVLVLNEGVDTIGNRAFEYSGLLTMEIPEGIKQLETKCFDGCPYLTSIKLPDSLLSIQTWAFRACTSLTSIIFGKGLQFISSDAFSNCPNLTSVTCNALTPPQLEIEIGGSHFTAENDTLYVPSEAVTTYQNDSAWSSAFTTITAIV